MHTHEEERPLTLIAENSRPRLTRPGDTADQLVRAIADLIITGALRPGERLDEISLASRFEVSRTPVREALSRLGAMGLVDRRPNRGAVVAEVSHQRLRAMFEAMAELESICARLSAERMTAEERINLERAHLSSVRLVHEGAEDDYEAHNTEFHTRLYAGAHNVHIQDLVAATRARLAPFRRAQFRLAGRLAKSFDEHDAIVTAIMRGDGKAAEMAMRAHVTMVSEASSEVVNASHG